LVVVGAVEQFDPSGGVGEDGVLVDGVAGPRGNPHAVTSVVGDCVAGSGVGAADEVVVAVLEGQDGHAVAAVAQWIPASHISADQVALEDVAVAVNADAVVPVAGDDVADDDRVGRAGEEFHAVAVGQRPRAAGVGADEVALDQVAGAAVDPNAILEKALSMVSCPSV
jgi:hypothetical protein